MQASASVCRAILCGTKYIRVAKCACSMHTFVLDDLHADKPFVSKKIVDNTIYLSVTNCNFF